MATSANALYVVRLVLGSTARRRFSTAALAQPREVVRAHTAASSSYAPATPAQQTGEFLEAESDEYAGAAEFLPDRAARETAPIPWPTLFSHGDAAKPHRAKPCDIVARLVAENKLGPARKVFNELRALHTPVQQRKLYLSPALASLAPTPEGRADFLFWLELYPNRPAVNNNPALRETWEPIVYRLLGDHADDGEFLTDFLFLAGRKGLLPAVFPVIIAPLTAILPPEPSERAVERALNAYFASTTSQHSASRRAEFIRGIADTQVERWWNMYLRSLAIVGWDESARALLYSPPHGVSFSRFTRSVVLGQGLGRRERAAAAREAQLQREREDPLAAVTDTPGPANEYLARRVRKALDPTQLPSVGELADLQRAILKLQRAGLMDRFRHRFCYPPSMPEGRKAPSVAVHWWRHAEVLRLSADGEHEDAVRAFRAHFLWVGLPPTNVAPADAPASYTAARRVPSTQVITSVLPSILALLSRADRQTYLGAYMALSRRQPSTLRPSEFTYLAIVRAIAKADGPSAATAALNTIAAGGADPGEAAWNALLLSLIGQGQVDAALAVLEGMERRAPLGSAGTAMPPPSARTYAGLVRLCARHGRHDQAALVLARFKAWLAAQPNAPGTETSPHATVFSAARAEITAAQRGHPRLTPQEAERARRKNRGMKQRHSADQPEHAEHDSPGVPVETKRAETTAAATQPASPPSQEKEHAFA